jgi:hypothetical protein
MARFSNSKIDLWIVDSFLEFKIHLGMIVARRKLLIKINKNFSQNTTPLFLLSLFYMKKMLYVVYSFFLRYIDRSIAPSPKT